MILKNTKWGARCTFSPTFTAYFTETDLRIDFAGKVNEWLLVELTGAEAKEGLVWTAVTINLLQGPPVRLDGLDKTEGQRWVTALQDTLLKALAEAGVEAVSKYEAWSKSALGNLPKNCWQPSWQAQDLLRRTPLPKLASGLDYNALAAHPAIRTAQQTHPLLLRAPPQSPDQLLASELGQLNERFFEVQSKLPMFDTLETSPLTQEQRRAVICFDSKLLVVAAAGSGKTATMVAKAAYAIAMGIARPEEILLLAFNADAADELKDRLDLRLQNLPDGDKVSTRTFHRFGLDVIGAATNAKPRPAPWLENGQDLVKVAELMAELALTDKAFNVNLMLVRTVFSTSLGRTSVGEAEQTAGGESLLTLRGEIVKSREEQLIADWLFFHGVEYQYESRYKHDTADAQHSQYHPDFYYPGIDLYHEHFALDAHGNPPPHFKDYAAGIAWKRALHTQHQTQLIETTSHTLRIGEGLDALEMALISRGVELKPDPGRLPPGRPPLENEVLAKIIRNLIKHAKGNQLDVAELATRSAKLDPLRGPLIVSLYAKVLELWQRDLSTSNTVDFEDMISMAIIHAEEGVRYRSPYKLVIADEYQDSSFDRARLLRAITSRLDTFLTCVGDDWQSINRFAGADIGVMRNFEHFFGGGTTLMLSHTFRCPEQLCQVSSHFVQQNPLQLRKQVQTTSTVKGNAIQCYAAASEDEQLELIERMVSRITIKLRSVWEGRRKPTIMVLGRYRNDQPANWSRLQKLCGQDTDLTYSTVHSSKGTEADYVLLVNVVRGRRGFPSQIEDDPILQIAMPEPEEYPFAEERRLFYVALTRARRGSFIFTLEHRVSPFLTELQAQGMLTIVNRDGAPVIVEPCPVCKVGMKRLKNGPYSNFYGCSNFPSCKWTESVERSDGRFMTHNEKDN
ncbi:UvrD-helicase domain-containing protein [Pseudomonas sp. ML96]|uniref:UvrD-helicase domain-containing protein n=1 Tax=Pseudomonas sp. ML96 TaxID=1523503 RepID=UPI000690E304|nr:UvrD-helicase domain-containing protein [Pseudomonas sp. ML96]